MNRILFALFCSLSLTASGFGMGKALDLKSAVVYADLIARIKVTSLAAAPAGSGYKQVATATVTDAIKGVAAGGTIEILSDNGFICPNVFYEVGDDAIVFARREPNGSYETMNKDSGKCLVTNGTVPLYSFRRIPFPLFEPASAEEIRKEYARTAPVDEIIADLRQRLTAVK